MTKLMASKYRTKRLEVLHKTAAGLGRLGVIDKATLHEFDRVCLIKVRKPSAQKATAKRLINR